MLWPGWETGGDQANGKEHDGQNAWDLERDERRGVRGSESLFPVRTVREDSATYRFLGATPGRSIHPPGHANL